MIDDDDPLVFLPEKELSQDVQALINNGLDFLDQARVELEASKPKFSVISFWTAVEILLKVPLAHEHWSLVCNRKFPPNRQAYLAGGFQSVTYEETRTLLRDVLEKPISEDTHQIFDKVRKHRNRLVHFYHTEFTDAQVKQILNEQADAWFRLNQLIRRDWRPVFGEALYHKLSRDESRLLRTSEFYIGAKFRSLKLKLEELRAAGNKLVKCPVCKKRAGIHSKYNESSENTHHETDCLVCGYVTELYLYVTCPECSKTQRFDSDDDAHFICIHCEHTMSAFDLLDESNSTPEDYLIMGGPASCSDCDGYKTVCGFGDKYLCVSCLSLHDSIADCEYCGESSTKVPDMSSLFGCSFCEGNHNLYDDD